MSVFRVKVNNIGQGLLDRHPTSGAQMNPSLQRTVFVTGPHLIYRKLKDGDQFTDSNYWKRYVSVSGGGTAPNELAFLEIVTDDGSLWVDHGEENGSSTFPKVATLTPVVSSVSGGLIDEDASGFADNNVVDVLNTYGGYASYVQILNTGSVSLKVRYNGDVAAVMDLAAGDQQVFNHGDALISKIEFGNASGSTAGAVQVVLSVKSLPVT